MHLGMPEAQSPEVNLSCLNQKDMCCASWNARYLYFKRTYHFGDLALWGLCCCASQNARSPESKVNLSRPNQKDMRCQISHFRDLALQKVCVVVHLRMPEARSPEVNLSHPNQKDTRCQISHFRDLALGRFAMLCISECPKPGVPK
jgi:hypothetical protein